MAGRTAPAAAPYNACPGWARWSSSIPPPRSGRARARAARGRAGESRSKTALVLGGGGFTGGVYEIGALRALDLLSVNRTVNEFDVYVGTSAGSFVAAAVANGVTPEEMMRVIVQQVPTSFPDARVSSLLRPNYRGVPVRRACWSRSGVAQLVRSLVRDLGQISAVDIAVGLAEVLPSGLYSGEGDRAATCARILSDPDRTDDFRLLQQRAVPGRHRPRHVRADRVRRRGLGRRADLHGRRRIERAADDLQAGPGQGPRAGRRRDRVDHQPRHRGRGRGEVHRRRQPAGPVCQRLQEADPDDHRVTRAPGVGHGLPADRLPGVQAARLPAAARPRAALGGALSRASTSSSSSPSPTTS